MAKKKDPIEVLNRLKQQNMEFIRTLNLETDRGAALVGAEYLNNVLEAVLRAVFINEPKEVDRLFDPFQPLATFSSRLRLVYCVGLIGPKLYEDYSAIKKIRNIFAHSYDSISFDDYSIAKEITKIQVLEQVKSIVMKPEEIDTYTNRVRYGIIIQWLAAVPLMKDYAHFPIAKDFKLVKSEGGAQVVY